jgi:hypothetical protein
LLRSLYFYVLVEEVPSLFQVLHAAFVPPPFHVLGDLILKEVVPEPVCSVPMLLAFHLAVVIAANLLVIR